MDLKRVEFDGKLDVKAIDALVEEFENGEQKKAIERNRYVRGDNAYIMDRKSPDPNAPDNKVPISYARKIINTVTGYMFKPGLVRYAAEDEAYLERLNEVFLVNKEPIKTAALGREMSTHGVAYEFHYVGGQPDPMLNVRAMPRFAMLPTTEVIPIYDYEVEPALRAFLRLYEKGGTQYVDAYYDRLWERYEKTDSGFVLSETGQHLYGRVPLVAYRNNEEMIGDFTPVKHQIDAYDVLMSDSINEFDRFAWAYLLLKGFGLDETQAADIKWKRAFSHLDSEDAVSFLTKDINSEYIKFLSEWIRAEIHNQSGIPDVSDIKFGSSASGTTIDKFIYLMELFTDPKESLFRDGLIERIRMIDGVLRLRDGSGANPDDVDITMDRNWPVDDLKNAETFEKYDGRVSRKTLLMNFAPFVKDVDEELEAVAEEHEAQMQEFYQKAEVVADAEPQETEA